ncbi:MAG: hypothetical protein ACRDV6_01155 [Acidimicrobiales bacterium]
MVGPAFSDFVGLAEAAAGRPTTTLALIGIVIGRRPGSRWASALADPALIATRSRPNDLLRTA